MFYSPEVFDIFSNEYFFMFDNIITGHVSRCNEITEVNDTHNTETNVVRGPVGGDLIMFGCCRHCQGQTDSLWTCCRHAKIKGD